jgi:hypothetical protein
VASDSVSDSDSGTFAHNAAQFKEIHMTSPSNANVSTSTNVELRPLTTTEVIVHKAAGAATLVGHIAVGTTKSIATGLWAGCKAGWNQGKPAQSAPKYFMDPNGNIIEVK